MTLFKNFRFRERVNFQFRSEGYNALNHTQFTGVNTLPRFDANGIQVNPKFGQVDAAASPRILQFAARITF